MAATRRQKTICIVTSIHPDYDSRIYKHCLSVRRLGYRTILISPWPPKEHDGIERLRFERSGGPVGRLRQMRAIWPLLRKANADLYHFHDLDLVPMMTVWRLISGRPVVYDVHENYPEEILHRFWVPGVIRLPLSWAVKVMELGATNVIRNVVIVVENQRRTIGKRWLNTLLLRNFASRELHNSMRPDHVERSQAVLLTASAYVNNGILLFLDVAEQVLQYRRDVQFRFVDRFGNDAALRGQVMERISRPPLAGHVQALPNIAPDKLMTYINQATIGASFDLRTPSRIKALPTKLFEYMAGELPIVATDLPGACQFVKPAGCGLLGQPEDPRTLVDAIGYLLDHRDEARAMGQRGGQAFMQQFNWEGQDAALDAFYKRILSRVPDSLSLSAQS